MAIKVGPTQVLSTSDALEQLRDQANAVLQNYLNHSYDVHAQGSWFGPAAMANTHTAEEIHTAQAKLTTQWGEMLQILRNAAHGAHDVEQQSQAAVTGVAGDL